MEAPDRFEELNERGLQQTRSTNSAESLVEFRATQAQKSSCVGMTLKEENAYFASTSADKLGGKAPLELGSSLDDLNLCPICKSTLTRWRVSLLLGRFRLSQCTNCQLVFQNPPKEVPGLYSDGYFGVEEDQAATTSFDELKRWSFERMMRGIIQKPKIAAGGRVLDVGCGRGALLDVLSAKGFDAHGVELGEQNWEIASRRHPNRVRYGTLERARFRGNFFDLVTIFDVIEHMSDPMRTLKEVRRVLKPKGFVYLLTPNIHSINSLLLGKHWYQYKPNEHLFYFSPNSLSTILKQCEFSDILIHSSGVYTDLGRVFHQRVSAEARLILNKFPGILRYSGLQRIRLWIPSGHISALARK